ncbi:hypothetical protein KM043_008065 [Ampulex compressa]|nr:hypothetical protein KM043_008065 [Ampulex compressa]
MRRRACVVVNDELICSKPIASNVVLDEWSSRFGTLLASSLETLATSARSAWYDRNHMGIPVADFSLAQVEKSLSKTDERSRATLPVNVQEQLS